MWFASSVLESENRREKEQRRGSSFESFLKKQGLHEEVHAAPKRAVALKVHDLMRRQPMNKSPMAAQGEG